MFRLIRSRRTKAFLKPDLTWTHDIRQAMHLADLLVPLRFAETVAVNRGMNVKAFDSLGEALQWLGIAPASKPDEGGGNRCA